jgi:chemotaxis protein methyltransferase CheR
MELLSVNLSNSQFLKICELAYSLAGIKLCDGKQELVKSRLMKRLRVLGMNNFDDYIHLLERDTSRKELGFMVDELTTNKTSFFREISHFDYLRQAIIPVLKTRRMRIWSAGCSSGEEPYSLAMILREDIQDIDRRDISLLATDICKKVLAKAREGLYDESVLRDIPKNLMLRYFTPEMSGGHRMYRINTSVKKLIRIAQLNLMADEWPMKGPFDAIFCRNVMIYFDKPTQGKLVQRFYELLAEGGHLFIGHSENLTGISHQYKFIQPAVYMK